MAEKRYTIKNIVTGFTFELTKAECDKLVVEEPYNFKVIDKDYVSPVSQDEIEASTYSQVVIGGENSSVKSLDEYTYKELKQFAKENELSTKGNTEELRERCIEFTKQQAEAQVLGEQPEQVKDEDDEDATPIVEE